MTNTAVLPQIAIIEESLLGALMEKKGTVDEVISILKPEHFQKEAHQHIYRSMLALFDHLEPVNLVTVSGKLRAAGELELIGGAVYLAHLTAGAKSVDSDNIGMYARMMVEATYCY